MKNGINKSVICQLHIYLYISIFRVGFSCGKHVGNLCILKANHLYSM